VTVIEGQLSDEAGLKKAASSSATVFVSFAGPTFGRKWTVCHLYLKTGTFVLTSS
jgi:hypothetical protein